MAKSLTEATIIQDFKVGRLRGFDYIFDRYYAGLFQYANSIILNATEAEDIAVRAFLKLWEKRNDFETIKDIRGYLYTVGRHSCFLYLRSARKQLNLQAELVRITDKDTEAASNEYIKIRIIESIYEEIDNLPPGLKEIFTMYYLDQVPLKSIAQKLGKPVTTIQSQKAKAISILRNKIKCRDLLPLIIGFGVVTTQAN